MCPGIVLRSPTVGYFSRESASETFISNTAEYRETYCARTKCEILNAIKIHYRESEDGARPREEKPFAIRARSRSLDREKEGGEGRAGESRGDQKNIGRTVGVTCAKMQRPGGEEK